MQMAKNCKKKTFENAATQHVRGARGGGHIYIVQTEIGGKQLKYLSNKLCVTHVYIMLSNTRTDDVISSSNT